jgi:hypothetical protein
MSDAAYNLSSIDSAAVLYNALIRSELQYVFVVWNNDTLTDSSKTESIVLSV